MINEIDHQLIYTATKKEREIFLYLKNNYEKIPMLTAHEIAESCFCSTTSVNRVCKKLNYQGFRELQTSVKYKLHHDHHELTNREMKNFDLEKMEKFIKQLNKNVPIYIYGEGASKVSCLYLYRQLIKIGYTVINLDDREFLYLIDNCTIIIISNSGETKKILTTTKRILSKPNVEILGITRFNSTLSKQIDICIEHNIEINQLDKIQTEQQMHILYLINEIISLMYYN